MATKVTITVRDELWDRLKEVKDRFNVSRVCQAALEREVGIQEILLKEKQDMETVVDRLRAEKEKHDERYREMGRKHGIHEAKRLPYEMLMDIVSYGEAMEQDPHLDWYENMYQNNFYAELELLLKDVKNNEGANDPAFDEENYCLGWVEGVMETWEEIKDEL